MFNIISALKILFLQLIQKCSENIFEVIDQIKNFNLNGKLSTEIANPPEEREMYYIKIAKIPILQYCVKIMIQILYVSVQ